MSQRHAVTMKMAVAYKRSTKREKSKVLAMLRRDGDLTLSDEDATLLSSMSAATIETSIGNIGLSRLPAG